MFDPIVKNALEKLRDDFLSGSIKKIENLHEVFGTGHSKPSGFNMKYVEINTSCGTVCCIQGYLESRRVNLENISGEQLEILDELFYPTDSPRNVFEAGPKDAAAAIQNALEGSHSPWRDVVITKE